MWEPSRRSSRVLGLPIVRVLGLILLAEALVGCATVHLRPPRFLPTVSENGKPPVIVMGFVGFLDRPDDIRLSVVQLGERLRETYPTGVYVEVFQNREKSEARRVIHQLLDVDQDGALSSHEKRHADIILYGHSWGGGSVVSLARALRKDDIPVSLTVQVDSIHKLLRNDGNIPPNVAEAANFYQPHGFFHGRHQIHAVDPEQTRILGNYRFEYERNSVRCPPSFSWYEMYFARSHIQMDCDPKVWAEVEALIRRHLPAPPRNEEENDQP